MANPRLDVSIVGRKTRDDAIGRVIDILRANQQTNPILHPRSIADTRRQIAVASAEYRAAVTGLVIEGSLNIDDGRELLGVVEAILREAEG